MATRAVYESSVDQYIRAIGTNISTATEAELDRAVLAAFADVVNADSDGPVADIGCGPGRVAAFLARRGVRATGIDIAPSMVEAAKAAHPSISFVTATLYDFPFRSAALAGVICWYSLIHSAPEQLNAAFVQLRDALEPGGHLLLAFQAGSGEAVRRRDAYGTGIELTSYRHSPEDLCARLTTSGFDVRSTTCRDPELEHERTRQAFVIARRVLDA